MFLLLLLGNKQSHNKTTFLFSLSLWADWAQQTALLLCDMGWGCSHLETQLIQNIQGGSLKGQPVVPAVSWELTGAVNWWPGSPSTYFSAWLGCSRLGTWILGGSVPSGQVRSHKASYVRTQVLVIRASHRSKGRGIRPPTQMGDGEATLQNSMWGRRYC